jgi:hypothetical protein
LEQARALEQATFQKGSSQRKFERSVRKLEPIDGQTRLKVHFDEFIHANKQKFHIAIEVFDDFCF